MKIAISGATGFVGNYLTSYFSEKGYTVIALTRKLLNVDNNEKLSEILGNSDIVVNLAGTTIGKRWSKSYKKLLINSRIQTTRTIVDTINRLDKKPQLLISVSAVGLYPSEGIFDEYNAIKGEGFLSDLCEMWEGEAHQVSPDVRLVIARLGVVVANNGGAFPKLTLPAKLGVATVSGSGKQPFSWISLHDLARAFDFIISNKNMQDAVNLTSGEIITNEELVTILKKHYRSLLKIKIPAWFFQLILGEASEFVLKGQSVLPKKLTEAGFVFEKPTIERCLKD